jgi:cell division protein FtsI/penicillin-binding protein 2
MLIPLTLTLMITATGLVVAALLFRAAWKRRWPNLALPATSQQLSQSDDFGPRATNRWLLGLRSLLLTLILAVLAMHCYWVFSAGSDPRSNFSQAKRLDSRNIRLAESGLKGWVLDRSGKLENALARYRSDGGVISRDYPLGAAAVHLTGYSDYVFGSGGIEYALRKSLTEPVSTANELVSPVPVGKDVTVSIDGNLQREAYNLLGASGKPAAAVVLLLPANEVLAMASTPSFDPLSISREDTWREMAEQAEDAPELSPLVNRALGTLVTGGRALYYRPGSTFKVFTAAVAIESGLTGERFTCRGEGFTPPGSHAPIRDFEGEVHGTIGFQDAFRLSCNQYFAQLGLKLGKERLYQYARRLGFALAPDDGRLRAMDLWQTIHGDPADFNFIFAPPISRMNLSRDASDYDIALQSFGQGYDDMTVFKMALLAAAAAHPEGTLIAPTLEVGATPKSLGQFVSAQSAAQLRSLMHLVVQSGTAAGAFSRLRGVSASGKTGTADRDVPVYDSNGDKVIDYIDKNGVEHYKTTRWTDGWFIGFAPAENPQIAFAVMVENGGQGARSAAPIAVKLIEKALSLGYVRPGGPATAPDSSKPNFGIGQKKSRAAGPGR